MSVRVTRGLGRRMLVDGLQPHTQTQPPWDGSLCRGCTRPPRSQTALSHHALVWQKGEEALWGLMRALIPLMGAPPSRLNHLPKPHLLML